MGALGKIPLQAGKNPMGALGKIPLQAGKKGVPCLWLSFLYILSSFSLFLGSPPIDTHTIAPYLWLSSTLKDVGYY